MLARTANKLTALACAGHFSRYSVAGIINTLAGYIVSFSLYYFGASATLASFFGYVAGLLLSFFLSKKFVFRAQGNIVILIARFVAAFAVAFALNMVIIKSFLHFGLGFYLGQIAASAVYFVVFFLLLKYWVFTERQP